MSEFKGTKGEWIFCDNDMKIRGSGDIEGRTVIANVSPKMDYTRGMGTQCANARLMAAAPELLEALKDAVNNINTIAANTDHAEGFFNAMMNAVSACDRYEKIINKALEG